MLALHMSTQLVSGGKLGYNETNSLYDKGSSNYQLSFCRTLCFWLYRLRLELHALSGSIRKDSDTFLRILSQHFINGQCLKTVSIPSPFADCDSVWGREVIASRTLNFDLDVC